MIISSILCELWQFKQTPKLSAFTGWLRLEWEEADDEEYIVKIENINQIQMATFFNASSGPRSPSCVLFCFYLKLSWYDTTSI